jgi:hypothetical protein
MVSGSPLEKAFFLTGTFTVVDSANRTHFRSTTKRTNVDIIEYTGLR